MGEVGRMNLSTIMSIKSWKITIASGKVKYIVTLNALDLTTRSQ